MSFLKWVMLFAMVFCSVTPLYAKDVQVSEIVVEEDSTENSHEVGSSSSSIDLKDYEGRTLTVNELLGEQVGVHIRRFGGLEEATSISIRGSDPQETVIFLDGVPLDSSQGSNDFLALLSVDHLESIDVFRGLPPLYYGVFPSGGAILMHSAKIKKGIHHRHSFQYGSFNSLKWNSIFSQGGEKAGILGSLTFSRTSGDFSFNDDNGTPVNLNDDQRIARQNNESWTIHPLLKVDYSFDDKTELHWIGHFIGKHNGVPGLSSNQSNDADLFHSEFLTSAELVRHHFFHEDLSFKSQIYFRYFKDQFSDLKGEIGLGGTQDNNDMSLIWGQRGDLTWFLGVHHQIDFFASYQFEHFSPENYTATPDQGSTSARKKWSLGVEDEISFFDEHLILKPSVWTEHIFNQTNNDDPSFLTPATFQNQKVYHLWSYRMSLLGKLTPALQLHAEALRTYRFPTFPELFGDKGGVVGNPFLDPQRSLNWEAGAQWDSRSKNEKWGFFGEINYFDRRLTDLIQFIQNAGFARAENVGKARVKGLEAQLKLSFNKKHVLRLNYTLMKTRDEAANWGRRLPGRAEHELDAYAETHFKRWKLFAQVQWMDAMYLDQLNTRLVSDRALINSGIQYQFDKGFLLSFEAKNLSDSQIVDVVGFPLPGRSFWGRIEYKR